MIKNQNHPSGAKSPEFIGDFMYGLKPVLRPTSFKDDFFSGFLAAPPVLERLVLYFLHGNTICFDPAKGKKVPGGGEIFFSVASWPVQHTTQRITGEFAFLQWRNFPRGRKPLPFACGSPSFSGAEQCPSRSYLSIAIDSVVP
jgi:hypothetical protein